MSLIDRLLGRPGVAEPPGPQLLREALRELEPSTRELAETLDADPCASDPTREECDDDLARALTQRGTPAAAIARARQRRSE